MSDFANSDTTIMPGFGSPAQRQYSADNNQSAGTSSYTLTFSPGVRRGYARLRTKGSTAVPPTQSATGVVTTSLKVTASDGTRTYTLRNYPASLGAANENLDITIPFNLDIVAVTFVFTLVTTTAAVYVDVEVVAGN